MELTEPLIEGPNLDVFDSILKRNIAILRQTTSKSKSMDQAQFILSIIEIIAIDPNVE